MKTTIISGNFSATIDGELDESKSINVGSEEKPETATVGDVIREAGVTYIVQRDGLSSVYKSLLDKGQKRNTVEFNDGNAAKFRESLSKALTQYGDFTVSVEQHVPSEGGASPMVRATAFVDALSDDGDKEAQMRQLFAVQGMADADSADRDALIAFAHKQGLGIQPPTRPGTKKAAATA